MTYKELQNLIEGNNIQKDVIIQSDSGWEAGKTDIDTVYYNKEKNIIVLTGKFDGRCTSVFDYDESEDWEELL